MLISESESTVEVIAFWALEDGECFGWATWSTPTISRQGALSRKLLSFPMLPSWESEIEGESKWDCGCCCGCWCGCGCGCGCCWCKSSSDCSMVQSSPSSCVSLRSGLGLSLLGSVSSRLPPEERSSRSFELRHFIRRFWNQIFTYTRKNQIVRCVSFKGHYTVYKGIPQAYWLGMTYHFIIIMFNWPIQKLTAVEAITMACIMSILCLYRRFTLLNDSIKCVSSKAQLTW